MFKEYMMTSQRYKLSVLLLAAGKSQRFNGIKMLTALAPQKLAPQQKSLTLIEHVLNNIEQALPLFSIKHTNIHIATGQYHQQIAALLAEKYSLLYCNQANLGLGHTIAQAVAYIVENKKNTSHIMIALADQIALESNDYAQLIAQSITFPNAIICAKAQNHLMSPAIFPQAYFSELTQLTGDKGARSLLIKNKDQLQSVSLPTALIDIDTPQDLAHWQKITNK